MLAPSAPPKNRLKRILIRFVVGLIVGLTMVTWMAFASLAALGAIALWNQLHGG